MFFNKVKSLFHPEDRNKSFIKRHPGLVLYLLITLLIIALFLEQSSIFENIENKIVDLMFSFRGEQKIGDEIVFLNIDDKSMDYLGWWPWSHQKLAIMIEGLDYYQPTVIYLDFPIKSNVEDYISGNSQLLAENILQADNVIMSFDVLLGERTPSTRAAPNWLKNSAIRMDGIISSNQIDLASRIDLPDEIFGSTTKYLGAHVNLFEKDNSVRYQPLLIKYENKYYPSQELIAAAAYLKIKPSQIIYKPGESIQLGSRQVPVNKSGRMMINYPGQQGSFKSYSIKDLWEGSIPVEDLENKIIIVSLTATGLFDNLITPISKNLTPGEKSATVIQNIITDSYIFSFEASANLQIYILLGIGLFCAFMLPRVSLIHRFTILIVFLFVLINLNFILFSSFNTISKTFYPALEIVLFMLAAPMLKSEKDKKKKADKELALQEDQIENLESFQQTMVVPVSKPRHYNTDKTREMMQEPIEKKAVQEPVRKDQETVELSAIDHSAINLDEPVISEEQAAEDLENTPAPASQQNSSDEIPIAFDNSGQPSQFGRYKITDILGQGAMGTVYKGLDPAIDRPVALKTIRFDKLANPSEIKEMRKRFMLEAKAAGNFSHPNIVTIYDVGQDNSIQYIAMEYLEGQTLEDLIKRKLNMNFRIVAKVISQVCSALAYAHEHQVVHRDIKPANIMVLEGFAIKVMDFGIAHLESSNMTQTGVAMGTPNYISPEQLSGKEVTQSSDIFSLGVVMYELLTGHKPFEGENLSNLIMKILNTNPEQPSSLDDKIPPLLDHVVLKALKKDPLERYHSAKEMASALEDFITSFSHKSVRI